MADGAFLLVHLVDVPAERIARAVTEDVSPEVVDGQLLRIDDTLKWPAMCSLVGVELLLESDLEVGLVVGKSGPDGSRDGVLDELEDLGGGAVGLGLTVDRQFGGHVPNLLGKLVDGILREVENHVARVG